jgi:hypothetical protein
MHIFLTFQRIIAVTPSSMVIFGEDPIQHPVVCEVILLLNMNHISATTLSAEIARDLERPQDSQSDIANNSKGPSVPPLKRKK